MRTAHIRKIVDYIEDIIIEGNRNAPEPLRMVASAAVIKNPWYSENFIENLQPEISSHAKTLGDCLVPRVVALAGGAEKIEAFGKAAIVGIDGEIEHAAGLIHTLYFGNAFRTATQGDSFLLFTNTRTGPGGNITIPMKHKSNEQGGSRAHYLTLEFSISDAPASNEIIVALAASTGGRVHHRIGNRANDMREMGVDQTGKPLK